VRLPDDADLDRAATREEAGQVDLADITRAGKNIEAWRGGNVGSGD